MDDFTPTMRLTQTHAEQRNVPEQHLASLDATHPRRQSFLDVYRKIGLVVMVTGLAAIAEGIATVILIPSYTTYFFTRVPTLLGGALAFISGLLAHFDWRQEASNTASRCQGCFRVTYVVLGILCLVQCLFFSMVNSDGCMFTEVPITKACHGGDYFKYALSLGNYVLNLLVAMTFGCLLLFVLCKGTYFGWYTAHEERVQDSERRLIALLMNIHNQLAGRDYHGASGSDHGHVRSESWGAASIPTPGPAHLKLSTTKPSSFSLRTQHADEWQV